MRADLNRFSGFLFSGNRWRGSDHPPGSITPLWRFNFTVAATFKSRRAQSEDCGYGLLKML
jgi:hypothetical protein